MKKLTLLLMAMSIMICLFACETTEKNIDHISDNTTQNPANISFGVNEEQPPDDDYDYSRCYIRFKNFDEYADWYKSGKYLSDFYVDRDGNRFDNLIQIGGEIQRGERFLYQPYVNEKALDLGSILVYLNKSGFIVSYFQSGEIKNSSVDNANKCHVLLRYLDDEYKNTSDIISAFKHVIGSDSFSAVTDEKKIKFDGKEKEVLTTSQTYDDGTTYIFKNFIWEDVLVSIEYDKESDFKLQEFLDGFELRPLVLTDEKIPA